MSYNKTVWAKGDVITAEKLNNIENGIEAAEAAAASAVPLSGIVIKERDNNGNPTKVKVVNMPNFPDIPYSTITDIEIDNLFSTENFGFSTGIQGSSITSLTIPCNAQFIGMAFRNCASLTEVTFEGRVIEVQSNAFGGCTALTDIYVPWAENDVSDAPWGAANATIHYNVGAPSEITDTWDEVFAHIQAGDYATHYHMHDYKTIDLGAEGNVTFEIVGFDVDDLAAGGKAPISMLATSALATTHRMNPAYSAGTSGTGSLGGWEASEMRTYVQETIKPLIPEAIRTHIAPVLKHSIGYTLSVDRKDQVTTDEVWICSAREACGVDELEGPIYNISNRIKSNVSTPGTPIVWWLRSGVSGMFGADGFRSVGDWGGLGGDIAELARGVVVGFCLA